MFAKVLQRVMAAVVVLAATAVVARATYELLRPLLVPLLVVGFLGGLWALLFRPPR